MLDRLFPSNKNRNLEEDKSEPTTSGTVNSETNGSDLLRLPKDLSEIEYMESLYMKSTVSALRVLKEIRSGSSTVSVFSLPPLQASGLEDDSWKTKVGALEQVAEWILTYCYISISLFFNTYVQVKSNSLKSCVKDELKLRAVTSFAHFAFAAYLEWNLLCNSNVFLYKKSGGTLNLGFK